MKKVITLVLLFLFWGENLIAANQIQSIETYTGEQTLFVTDTESSGMFDFGEKYKISTTFNVVLEKDMTTSAKKIILQYYSDKYDILSLRPVIKFAIDDKLWELTSAVASTNIDGLVQITIGLPDPIVNAIMETKNDISIRFFYSTSEGDKFRDYTVSKKFIFSVQKMYKQTPKRAIYLNF